MNHISYARGNLTHPYKEVITSVTLPTNHERGLIHPSNQTEAVPGPNQDTRWDELISDIRDDHISSLVDVQPNAS
jgi:hypothetical protein